MPEEAPATKDYIAQDLELPTTAGARWNANIRALRLLKDLEAEGRQASPEEQRTLAQYSGFGDSSYESAFRSYRPRGEGAEAERWDELREVTTDEELAAVGRSRLNAFYTNPAIIKTMWDSLDQMGAGELERLSILEPSAGSGRFLAYQPERLARKSDRTAVELDSLTARIVKQLNPESDVWHSGFEAAPLPDNHYDIAISNVPFGNYAVHDPEFIRTGRKHLAQQGIHNYFFAKSLDKLKPGGVLAFITSHGTLDAPSRREVREYLADQADLVGAVRLPEDIFPDTDVVTDIIYLRKRKEGEASGDAGWVDTEEVSLENQYGAPVGIDVNRYFMKNPDRVLGQESAEGTMYAGNTYTVRHGGDVEDIQGELDSTVQDITAARPAGAGPVLDPVTVSETAPSGTTRFRGDGMYQKAEDGALQVQKQGRMVKPSLSAKDAERVSLMVDIRDTASRLMDMEAADEDEGEMEATRRVLNDQYERFVKQHGHLNKPPNRKLMQDDPGAQTLAALEVREKGGKSWAPATVLSRRVIGRAPERNVGTPNDAMLVTLNETGRLDFDHMAQQLGESPEAVRAALEQDQLIFRNPASGHYETASTYLTGDVREKHRTAQQYAARDSRYQENVDALAEVLPPKVQAHEIATPLGAPWIPEEVINRWAYEHLTRGYAGNFRPDSREHRFFAYNTDNGRWYQPRNLPLDHSRAFSEFGTSRIGGDEILLAALQGKPVKVTMKNEDGASVPDVGATLAAQEKAREIQKSFQEWLWQDEARKEHLVERYNDLHNSIRPRLFDGSHQTFPGMAAEWQEQMREHQADAIYRTVHDGTALLAHEVGFGKTAVMVASAMERKRLGLASKAIFVVPKATHQQFGGQFLDIYPNAKLLVPGPGDFSGEKRQAFLNRMATGDWDGIILTGEQFQKIPVSPELEHRWIQQEKWEYQQALRQMQETHEGGGARKGRQKELEKKIADFEARLMTLREEMKARTDAGAVRYFDKMGIDQLYVDEADRYKNLQLHSQMGNVKGMPGSGSKRALDMLMKVRHVQESGGESPAGFSHNGVVFATGTPIANTIAEAWTMMRYLQLPELRKRGLEHFDAWANTYGEITEGLEATPQGTYKNTQRFAKFVNLPELSQLFQNVADIRVASEVPEMLEAQPCLIDDAGDAKRITVVAPSHQPLREYMDHVRERVDKLGRVDPRVDNMLKISTDSRKAALDLRMIDPTAPANPNGKIQMAAQNIAENFKNESENFGTQLVFLDYGTPKARDTTKESGDDDSLSDGEETAEELRELSNIYGTLKRELVARGVPEDQIAFVHDARTDQARQKLFDAVNQGEIRILIGSTEKVGVGVNVQERAYAAHHLDVPWRPRDVEQREGRIIRQGNEVYGPVVHPESRKIIGPGKCVRIYQYVQEGSFDEFMWQAVEVKANAIKSLMRRNITSRSADDIDSIVLSASEARALASGDPLVLEREKLRNELRNLRLARDSHRTQQEDARTRLNHLSRRIESYQTTIPRLEEDAAHVASLPEDAPFAMSVGQDQNYDKRPDAGRAMEAAMSALPMTYDMDRGSYRKIAEYRGFDVRAIRSNQGWQLQLVNPATELPHYSAWIDDLNPAGLPARLDHLIRGIPGKLKVDRESLETARSSVSTYREQLTRPFARGQELQDAQRRLAAVQAQMTGSGVADDNDADLVDDLLDTSDYDYDEGGSAGARWDDAPPTLTPMPSEPGPEPTEAAIPARADAASGLRPGGDRSFLLPRRQDAEEVGSAEVEHSPLLSQTVNSGDAGMPSAGPDGVEEAADEPLLLSNTVNSGAPEPRQELMAESIAALESAADGTSDKTLAGQFNLLIRDRQLTVDEQVLLQQEYQRLKAVEEEQLAQQVEEPPEPSAPAPAPEPAAAATEEAAAAETAMDVLPGIPKSLGSRGRSREWGGLVQGSPQVGQTVTITTRKGKTFERVVGEIVQSGPGGVVVRWAADDAPAPAGEPPPVLDASPSVDVGDALETLHDRNEANLESVTEDLEAREQQVDALREEVADYLEHVTADRDNLEAHADRYEAVDDALDEAMEAEQDGETPEEPQPSRRWLVTDPVDEEYGESDLDDPVERDLAAVDSLQAMPSEIRATHDALQERMGDLLDDYELTILARRLGPDPSPEDIDREEARLRRQGDLNAGQTDMFGATAEEPDALIAPEAIPEPEESGREHIDVLQSTVQGNRGWQQPETPETVEEAIGKLEEREEAREVATAPVADLLPVAEPGPAPSEAEPEPEPGPEPALSQEEPAAAIEAEAGSGSAPEPVLAELQEEPPADEEKEEAAGPKADPDDCSDLLVRRKPRGEGYNILDDGEAVGSIVQDGSRWLIKRNNRRVESARTLTAAKDLLEDPDVCGQLRQRTPAMATSGRTPSRVKEPAPKVKPLIEHPTPPKARKSTARSGKTNRGKGIGRIKRRLR